MNRGFWRVILCGLLWLSSTAGVEAGDWPQFPGPDRDGVSRETGLLDSWPDGRRTELASWPGRAQNPSTPVLAHGRLYLRKFSNDARHQQLGGTDGGNLLVLSLDAAD
jgi:hypothetical protein